MPRGTFVNNAGMRRGIQRHDLRYAEVQENPSDHYLYSDCGPWSIIRPAQFDVTNLIENPSFENSLVDGWEAAGANTQLNVVGSADSAVAGLYGLLFQQQDFSGVASLRYTGSTITLNEGDVAYYTVWVKAPVGTTILADFEYVNPIPGQRYSLGRTGDRVDGTGDWVQVTGSITFRGATNPIATTVDVIPRLTVEQPGAIAPFSFYVDGATVTKNFQIDTYFDGDASGAGWDGNPRNSTSTISRFSRNIGQLVDFTDIGLDLFADQGWGMPPVEDITTSFALNIAGAHFQRQRILPRTITLSGVIQGCCDMSEVAQKRRVIQRRLLGNFSAFCNDGFVLSYQPVSPCCGALARRLELRDCQYQGGLEGNRNNLHFERVALQFVSYDPIWYDPIERSEFFLDGAPRAVTLDSTAPVYPLIELRPLFGGNNLNFGGTLINDTILDQIVLRNEFFTLPDGGAIIIDTDPRRLSAIRNDTGEDVSYIIDHANSALGTPILVPGRNSVRWEGNGATIDPVLLLRWNERYLSADDITITSSCSVCGC